MSAQYGTQPGQQPPQTAGYGQPYAGATPAPAPLPPARPRRRWLPWALAGAALLTGIAIGGAGQPAPKVQTVTVAGPERVVNVPGPARTVTPASCTDALDLAEQIVTGPVVDAMRAASAGFTAVAAGDVGGLTAEVGKVKAASDAMDRLVPQYNAAAALCRAGS